MRTSYDRTTDSLYLELRPLPAKRTVEMERTCWSTWLRMASL
jgi:hypothetical protein